MQRQVSFAIVTWASAVLVLFCSLPARSVELERGEWRRVGESFACKVDSPKNIAPSDLNPDALLMACMHMGPFVIGGDARTLTTVLGTPHRTLPQPKEAKSLLWFLEQQDHYPYFIATVLKDRIVALQVTGTSPAKGYDFNHVNLGDGVWTLTDHFGSAFRVAKSDQANTDLWSYGVWPFSFELKAGRVTSIRINDPAQWR